MERRSGQWSGVCSRIRSPPPPDPSLSPVARQLTWSHVRGGLIALAAIAAVSFVVLKYSRVGALHGATFPLYVHVGEPHSVLVASEEWLRGQKIEKTTPF